AHREALGDSIRLDPTLYGSASEEQHCRQIEDPFLHSLLEVLGEERNGIKGKLRATDAWEIVGVPPGQRSQEVNVRLGEAMRELGWLRDRRRFGGPLEYAYLRGTPRECQVVVVLRRDNRDRVVGADGAGPF